MLEVPERRIEMICFQVQFAACEVSLLLHVSRSFLTLSIFFFFLQTSANESKKSSPTVTSVILICQKRRKLTWEDYFEHISKSDWWGGWGGGSETVSHSNINGHKHRQSPKKPNHAVSGLNFLTRSKTPHSFFATCFLEASWLAKRHESNKEPGCLRPVTFHFFFLCFCQSGSG